jgi:hydrogenase expression/formation protein HypE
MSHDLITRLFLPKFDNPALQAGDDGAVVQPIPGIKLVVSTDSHVVWPLFFPGGDIGRLAVSGTVNDVAVMGAKPLFLTAGFILEEGLEISLLEKVVASMQNAAAEAGIQIVAGDTKVVQKGKADGLYINTSGVGSVFPGVEVSGRLARPGDVVILSGMIGDHGIAVLSARGELGFETDVQSDVAPLNNLIASILDKDELSHAVHVLRDPTRGGVATSLNEIARQSHVCIHLDESKIPIRPAVSAVCEMLGFDPLYVANEGKLIVIVESGKADRVLESLKKMPYGRDAAIAGEVMDAPRDRVLVKTALGSSRVVDMLAGEMLPRIC